MPEYFPRPVMASRQQGQIRVGLLGRGIEGSRSPWLHGRAAELTGLSLGFELLDVTDAAAIGPILRRCHEENWRGLSVTMPWKGSLEAHLLGMSPDAIAIGGTNLLLRSDNGWIGENSDAEGFLRPLARRRLAFSSALVVGAGGAARAILHGLASMPFVEAVAVRARRTDASRRLVEEFAVEGREWLSLGWSDPLSFAPDLIVNATPLGSEGSLAAELPCPASWIRPTCTCFDLVYRPRETPLLRAARERGACRIEGLEMLTAQARRAFEAWTGHAFPEAELWREQGLDATGAPAS